MDGRALGPAVNGQADKTKALRAWARGMSVGRGHRSDICCRRTGASLAGMPSVPGEAMPLLVRATGGSDPRGTEMGKGANSENEGCPAGDEPGRRLSAGGPAWPHQS